MTRQKTNIPDGYKRCSKGVDCVHPDKLGDGWLPATLEYFYKDSSLKSGLKSGCKACGDVRTRTYASSHRERIRQYSREYKFRNRPEELQHLLRQEEMAAQGIKCCSKRDNCVHPDGPWLPANTEFFGSDPKGRGGLRSYCKACQAKMHSDYRRKTHPVDLEALEKKQQGYKLCKKGDQCQHPDGPWLPATDEYFYHQTDGVLTSPCKACRQKANTDHYLESHPEWALTVEMRNKGYKRCLSGESCVHPDGPWLPTTVEYFTLDKRSSDGCIPRCRECNKKRLAAWREQNQKRVKEITANYRKNRPDLVKARQKRYRDNNLEAVRLRSRLTAQRRIAIESSLPCSFSDDDWRRALGYFNGCCAVCGRPLKDLFGEHTDAADHWIAVTDPRPDNPGTVPTNMLPLCHGVGGCNNSKNNRPVEGWLIWKFGKRKANQILKRINAYFDWLRRDNE